MFMRDEGVAVVTLADVDVAAGGSVAGFSLFTSHANFLAAGKQLVASTRHLYQPRALKKKSSRACTLTTFSAT